MSTLANSMLVELPGARVTWRSPRVPSGPRKRTVPVAVLSVGLVRSIAAPSSPSPPLQIHVEEPASSAVATAPAEVSAMRWWITGRPTRWSTTTMAATTAAIARNPSNGAA